MRLLHPTTIKILASHKESPKTHLAHCWSEVFKWKASGKKHPKMFITDDYLLGIYLKNLYNYATIANCNLNKDLILSLKSKPKEAIEKGFNQIGYDFVVDRDIMLDRYFDSDYLFSDACSLYYKGINIFPDIFGDEWRKYVPVESLKEIKRQVDKTLNK